MMKEFTEGSILQESERQPLDESHKTGFLHQPKARRKAAFLRDDWDDESAASEFVAEQSSMTSSTDTSLAGKSDSVEEEEVPKSKGAKGKVPPPMPISISSDDS